MAVFIRLFSDLHLDFDLGRKPYDLNLVWQPPPLPEDSRSILILAGDLWHAMKPFSSGWLEAISLRFEHVIIVLGNHDYWGLSLQSAIRKFKSGAALLSNVTVLEKDTFTHSGVKFVGGTLWTDYNRDPIAMSYIEANINDYAQVTFGNTDIRRRVRAADIFEVHRQTAKYIFNNCRADTPGQPVVIVTHMAPHEKSVDLERYRHTPMLNLNYYTDLSKSIATHCMDVKLWVHGHIHKPVNYVLDHGMRVLSNPRGYQEYEGSEYNPHHQLRIDSL